MAHSELKRLVYEAEHVADFMLDLLNEHTDEECDIEESGAESFCCALCADHGCIRMKIRHIREAANSAQPAA